MDTTASQELLHPFQRERDPEVAPGSPEGAELSRRGFLRGAALAGGGLVAVTVAACAPVAPSQWAYNTGAPGAASTPPSPAASLAPSPSASPSPAASVAASLAPSPSPTATLPANTPAGWSIHDVNARAKVRRYLGKLAPPLKDIYGAAAFAKLADMLGAADNYPELTADPSFAQVPQVNLSDALSPLKPTLDGDVKVFNLSIDEVQQTIDVGMAPVAALGYNKAWPGPTIRVTEGDKVRAVFTNHLKETTGVHFHGVEFDDFFMDGVPFVTQKPFAPGESFTYEFTARPAGSMMYHSHHNATDQVGRGLLAAFLIDPKDDPDPKKAYAKRYGIGYDREYVWISNDTLGGFTINGHGWPSVLPVLAAVGDKVLVRFMNEGIMMHPWHLHGNTMHVVARDGRPLGSAAFDCDTLGVNPGERYDVVITADRPGVWAFHCHILPHVEGVDGMFGMVNTLLVVPKPEHVTAILKVLGIG